jgi:DNA replication protein DnaC
MNDPVLEHMRAAGETYLADIRGGAAPYWLTLWGRNGFGNGTGKTYLGELLRRAAAPLFSSTPPVKLLRWPALVERSQARQDTGASIAFAEECGLLLLDDIGAEHQTGAMLGRLSRILDSRLRKWTIITSNLSPDDWMERDARISSRLIRNGSRQVCCETTDFALRLLD